MITFITDKNGNKRVHVKTAQGGFTVQTNGNLPELHRMDADTLRKSQSQAVFDLSQYPELTPRQRKILLGR